MTDHIAGVDEVGRGPLAGPVVTCAIIITERIAGVTDSKQLSPEKRMRLAELIQEKALDFAIGRAEVAEIDQLNIHHATLLAMKRAVEGLKIRPSLVLVDGLYRPQISITSETVVNGDALVYEISAASILAKVTRDAEMMAMDTIYPGYGFAAHKGYATVAHRKALAALGPCPIHRKSFAPVTLALTERIE